MPLSDLKFYKNYLQNIAQAPPQQYVNDMQNAIYQQWENSTQTTGWQNGIYAQRQTAIGSKEYTNVDISIDYMTDMSTGRKVSDDYKIFSHRELSTVSVRGWMYQFANNYWIATDSDEYASPIKSIGVQRCNNIARWINPQNGAVVEWECVLGYEVMGVSPKYNKDIVTPNGHTTMIIQGNQDTLSMIKRNQRFIFNKIPYKLTGINNYLQNSIVDNDTTLLYLDLYADVLQANDDIVNDIANATDWQYELYVINPISEQMTGYNGKLNTQITLNGDIVQRGVIWTANENGTIDNNGNFVLTGTTGSTATFTCTFGDLVQIVNINIVATIADEYDIVISPLLTEISQGDNVIITATLNKNGIIQSDIVTTTTSGAPNTAYVWEVLGNNQFKLSAKQISAIPLTIEFESGLISETIQIKLKSIF